MKKAFEIFVTLSLFSILSIWILFPYLGEDALVICYILSLVVLMALIIYKNNLIGTPLFIMFSMATPFVDISFADLFYNFSKEDILGGIDNGWFVFSVFGKSGYLFFSLIVPLVIFLCARTLRKRNEGI